MMNSQADRRDRTAYVSGLQPTISDIELFEVFNRVAHVEKVIVRNGAVRHALVVFKTVEGLYQVLINFQGTFLHGRQLHIRPLRESSHANSEAIASMFEKVRSQGTCNQKRVDSVLEPLSSQNSAQSSQCSSFLNEYRNQIQPQGSRGYRNSSSGISASYGRRRTGFNNSNNMFPNQTYSVGPTMFDDHPTQQRRRFDQSDVYFEDYTEGARRFDSLANLIRASTPMDPLAMFQKNCDSNSGTSLNPREQRPRIGSGREYKQSPPTWKMELQIKNESDTQKPLAMSPQQFLAQIAHQSGPSEGIKKRNKPNLSVINPSLFYEQYPRTSSPVAFGGHPMRSNTNEKILSPHDPAVLAYSRMRVPQSGFAGLSPIDTNNCSFVTKHLGTNTDINTSQIRRDLTNDELSDMIVSTGNLRINPGAEHESDEPAPWSPLKRLRAESGSLSTAQVASPQFSPINAKSMEFNDTEDEVFGSENKPVSMKLKNIEKMEKSCGNVLAEQKISNYEDINNSRLPSNSHSAAPSSVKKSFVFPDYPMCRHSSVPSIAHLVEDLTDFCPNVTADAKMLIDEENVSPHYHDSSDGNPENADKGKLALEI